jgi:hypothetical protein
MCLEGDGIKKKEGQPVGLVDKDGKWLHFYTNETSDDDYWCIQKKDLTFEFNYKNSKEPHLKLHSDGETEISQLKVTNDSLCIGEGNIVPIDIRIRNISGEVKVDGNIGNISLDGSKNQYNSPLLIAINKDKKFLTCKVFDKEIYNSIQNNKTVINVCVYIHIGKINEKENAELWNLFRDSGLNLPESTENIFYVAIFKLIDADSNQNLINVFECAVKNEEESSLQISGFIIGNSFMIADPSKSSKTEQIKLNKIDKK